MNFHWLIVTICIIMHALYKVIPSIARENYSGDIQVLLVINMQSRKENATTELNYENQGSPIMHMTWLVELTALIWAENTQAN